MKTKQPKGKNKTSSISKRKTYSLKQRIHPVGKSNSSRGWFTEEDAKKMTKEVIGRFYNT